MIDRILVRVYFDFDISFRRLYLSAGFFSGVGEIEVVGLWKYMVFSRFRRRVFQVVVVCGYAGPSI